MLNLRTVSSMVPVISSGAWAITYGQEHFKPSDDKALRVALERLGFLQSLCGVLGTLSLSASWLELCKKLPDQHKTPVALAILCCTFGLVYDTAIPTTILDFFKKGLEKVYDLFAKNPAVRFTQGQRNAQFLLTLGLVTNLAKTYFRISPISSLIASAGQVFSLWKNGKFGYVQAKNTWENPSLKSREERRQEIIESIDALFDSAINFINFATLTVSPSGISFTLPFNVEQVKQQLKAELRGICSFLDQKFLSLKFENPPFTGSRRDNLEAYVVEIHRICREVVVFSDTGNQSISQMIHALVFIGGEGNAYVKKVTFHAQSFVFAASNTKEENCVICQETGGRQYVICQKGKHFFHAHCHRETLKNDIENFLPDEAEYCYWHRLSGLLHPSSYSVECRIKAKKSSICPFRCRLLDTSYRVKVEDYYFCINPVELEIPSTEEAQ